MNKLLNTALAAYRLLSSRSTRRYTDTSTIITICLSTAALVEELKDQIASLQDQLEGASTTGPKLIPAPSIQLNKYNALMTQLVGEAEKLRRRIQ